MAKTTKRKFAVSAKEVEQFKRLKDEASELRKQAAQLDKTRRVIGAKLTEAMADIEADEPVPVGKRLVIKETTKGRVSWKDLYIEQAGPVAAAEAAANVPTTTTILVV